MSNPRAWCAVIGRNPEKADFGAEAPSQNTALYTGTEYALGPGAVLPQQLLYFWKAVVRRAVVGLRGACVLLGRFRK